MKPDFGEVQVTGTGPLKMLVLQHVACEPPAAYEEELLRRGGQCVRVMVNLGERLPDWRDFDGIVVMGGPMGAYEHERLPWLVREKQLIADAVAAGTPMWGVCLGAQLLAAALGAAVTPGPAPEVGVLPVHCTEGADSDPVFSRMPESFHALQWHSDTFALPDGAIRLARSDAYENQAFVVNRAYGLQFHLEIRSSLAREWAELPDYARSLEEIMGPRALPGMLEQIDAHADEMTQLARKVFAGWLEEVVALHNSSAPVTASRHGGI